MTQSLAPKVGERFELRLEPGSEGVINLVAVAPTKLTLSLKGSPRHSGRSTFIKMEGQQTNLPPDTVCSVVVKTSSCGMPPREYTLSNVPLRIQGSSCSLEAEVDIFEASFFGKGTAELTVIPDFPFARECKLEEFFEFDNPLGVQGLESGKGPILIGKRFELGAIMSDRFKGSTLRLSVFNSVELKKGEKPRMAPNAMRYATFEWTHANVKEKKHWRAGCSSSEGHDRLAYFESFHAASAFDLRLEVLEESAGVQTAYLMWETPRALSFPKPKLTGFELKDKTVTARVENVDPGFKLPLEVSIWSYKPQSLGDAYSIALMDPRVRPELVEANSRERFWRLLLEGIEGPEQKFFALLRIPRSLTGTEEYVPIHTVMDYDEARFLPFDDDELWLEPSKSKGQPKRKQQKTPKEMATAVASEELPSRASRAPHFGQIWTGMRDNNLLVSIKLVGDVTYWNEARPFFSVCDPAGETELMRLNARPSQDNPRIYEALVPLEDVRIRNQKVSIRGQVSQHNALLWGELVADPPAFSIPYEGVPRLGELEVHIVELTDDTPLLEVKCRAQHLPNGKDGVAIQVRLFEFFSDSPEPVFLAGVPFRYDIAKGEGGLCDSRGRLVARLRDDALVRRLQHSGKYRVEARVLQNEKVTQSIDLPIVQKELGNTPRKLEGTMVYGAHPSVSEAFRNKVLVICERLKLAPDHLMACMALETAGTFSPSIKNSGGSRAYGLIQFTQPAVTDIDKTVKVESLAAMSAVEQLDWVHRYFVPLVRKHGSLPTLGDVYMAILCQTAIGKPDDHICYRQGQAGYSGNASLDQGPNGKPKGYWTKGDATNRAREWLERGQLLRK